MLGKMLIHGAVAAALIGSAAAVYAQARDNGYLPAPQALQAEKAPQALQAEKAPLALQKAIPAARSDNGYLRPGAADLRGDRDDHHDRGERGRERHDGRRGHDGDDD